MKFKSVVHIIGFNSLKKKSDSNVYVTHMEEYCNIDDIRQIIIFSIISVLPLLIIFQQTTIRCEVSYYNLIIFIIIVLLGIFFWYVKFRCDYIFV